MAGEQQLRAFIERILRLKEEQDTLAADIREVYAEAKGSGFDKTAMGQLVAHLRKVEKVGVAAVEEGQTVFDTYLDAYRRATGTGVATHTHEANQSYAEQKGRGDVDAKLVATVTAGVQTEIGRKALLVAVDAMIEAEGAGITEHEQPETATQSQSVLEARSMPTESMGGEISGRVGLAGPACGQDADAANTKPAPHSNPQPTSSPEADKTGEAVPPPSVSPVALSDDDVPAFLKKDKDGCLKLKDGHCRIGFETPALCSDCNNARMKARAGA